MALLRTVTGVVIVCTFACGCSKNAGGTTTVAASFSGVVGDWAGWAYQRQGGDFPVRFFITERGGSLRASMQRPHLGVVRKRLKSVRMDGDVLVIEQRDSLGGTPVWKGPMVGGAWSGVMSRDGEPILDFEVVRSSCTLPRINPKDYAGAAGLYRVGPDRMFLVSKWFWGELRVQDSQTGRDATLFATSPDEFFAGSSLYVPSPIVARVSFKRTESGDIEALTWAESDSAPIRAKRMRFVEEPLKFAAEHATLNGTLIKPPGPGPFPGIVMLGGSGWSTRDSVGALGRMFAGMGVATLIYDKRGYGASTGDQTVPFERTARDAVAAVQSLRRRPEIRDDEVGVFGVSRGGWFAPLSASLSKDIAFLIMFVAPAISPAEQETTRRLNVLRAEGASESDVEQAADYVARIWRYARTGEDWEGYVAARAGVEERGWLNILGGSGERNRESDDWRWAAMNMHYNPIPALEKVNCPVLAMFGERDRNVTPAQNLEPMKAALERAGNRDVTLFVVPEGNHGLRPVGADGSSPRLHRTTGYRPERSNMPREWLGARVHLYAK